MAEELQEDAHVDESAEAQTEDVEETSPDSSPETEDSKPEKGLTKRIDELTRYRREAERERDYWRELAMQNNDQRSKLPEQVEQEPPRTLEDFEYDEAKYQQYILEKAVQEAQRGAVTEAERVLNERQQQQEIQAKHQQFQNRENKYADTIDDYWQVARNDDVPVSQAMAEAITDSPDGPAVLYYLGKNPDIASMIAGLPPQSAAREIGKIEAKLTTQAASTSKAPPPAKKIDGVDPAIEKNPDDMSIEEWTRWREKQLKR
jgi:hypothetical protein